MGTSLSISFVLPPAPTTMVVSWQFTELSGSCSVWSASFQTLVFCRLCLYSTSLYYEDRGMEVVIGKPYMYACARANLCMYVCLCALTLPLDAMIDEMHLELIGTQPVKRNSTYPL